MPKPLRLFLLTLTTFTTLCLLTELACTHALHLPYPYNWPLYDPRYSFGDLIIYHPRFAAFGTPAFFSPPWYPFTYTAPAALLYRFLYTFPDYITAFLVLAGTLVASAIVLFAAQLRVPQVSLLRPGFPPQHHRHPWPQTLLILLPTLCAYPIAFEFQQANLEIFAAALTTAGIWAYYRRRPWPAAIFFGLAASLKLFPIIFLVLFLTRRQYRHAAVAATITLTTILLSLWIACPNLPAALAGTRAGALFFTHDYTLRTTTAFDHSLFSVIKAAVVLRNPAQTFLAPSTLTIYLLFAALAGAAICLRIRKLPLLNQILALSIVAILLPPVSFDYTLLNLYAPWALLVLFTFPKPGTPGLTPIFVSLAIALAPTSEFILHGVPLGGQLRSLTLATLLVIALYFPCPNPHQQPQHERSS